MCLSVHAVCLGAAPSHSIHATRQCMASWMRLSLSIFYYCDPSIQYTNIIILIDIKYSKPGIQSIYATKQAAIYSRGGETLSACFGKLSSKRAFKRRRSLGLLAIQHQYTVIINKKESSDSDLLACRSAAFTRCAPLPGVRTCFTWWRNRRTSRTALQTYSSRYNT